MIDVDQAERAVWLEHRFSLPDDEIQDLVFLLAVLRAAAFEQAQALERQHVELLEAELRQLKKLPISETQQHHQHPSQP